MPTIGSTRTATVFPKVRSYCFMKERWADAWQWQPYVTPDKYIYSVAPEVSRGEMLYDFGLVNQPDVLSSIHYPQYIPYNSGPWYVMFVMQRPGQQAVIDWMGQVAEDEIIVDRPTVPSGKQRLAVFGFEHYLDRRSISKSYCKQNGREIVIDHVLAFNQRHERGGQLFGNQSGLVDSNGVYRFYDPTDIHEPGRWTNLEIIQYLLKYFVNTLPDDTPNPIQFILSGQYQALNEIMDIYDFGNTEKRMSVWHALNQLIERKRGLGFVLRCSGDPGAPVYIHVFTHVDSPITAGGSVLPANAEQIHMDIPTAWPYSQLLAEIPFRYSASNLFYRIVVEGERALFCGSFRRRDATLEPFWDTDILESDYENVDDDTRLTDRFRAVYAYFAVPRDWTWYVMDTAGQFRNLMVNMHNDGTATVNEQSDDVNPPYNYMKTFERFIPLLEGWDYTREPAVNNNPSTATPEFIKMMALLPSDSPEPWDNGQRHYYFAERGNETDEDLPNAMVRPLDHLLGVEVRARMAHSLGLNEFHAGAGFESDTEPLIDTMDMIVTAAVYSDVRPRVRLEGIAVPVPETKPELVINLPDCHYWYVSVGTVYDVDGAGNPVELQSNPVVRDDTDRLRQVAGYLRWWFSRQRQAIGITIKLPGQYAQPGMLLTSISSAWSREPVNAIITAREVNFDVAGEGKNGYTRITTAYLELDNMISILDDPQRRTRGSWGIHAGRRR